MLSFATEFPVASRHSAANFLEVVINWITGSPHSRFSVNDLVPLIGKTEGTLSNGREQIELLAIDESGIETAGLRYTKHRDGLVWITTIVLSRSDSDSWVSVRTLCECDHPAAKLPNAKKPVVVRMLLDALGGSTDAALLTQSTPHMLKDTQIDFAARLIRGESGCRLPIVYVSAGPRHRPTIDSEGLAHKLSGMAHVVVEPNRGFSFRLRNDVDSANVYGGTIGVYWPDGSGRRSFSLGRQFESLQDLATAVFDEVRTALTNRRAFSRTTWGVLQEGNSRKALDKLRAAGSQEVDKYIAAFDLDAKAKEARLNDAEKEIRRLRAEVCMHESRLPDSFGVVLRSGDERDYYPNEIRGILRDAIADAAIRVVKDSRRRHVLDAVLSAESRGGEAAELRERLKELLRGYRIMDKKVRRSLEDMGFDLTDDGKHHKLTFLGDERYTFTLPKTGSDHRGGLNAAAGIARLLF